MNQFNGLLILLCGCWSSTVTVGPLVTSVRLDGQTLVGDTCSLARTTTQVLDKTSQKLEMTACEPATIRAELPVAPDPELGGGR